MAESQVTLGAGVCRPSKLAVACDGAENQGPAAVSMGGNLVTDRPLGDITNMYSNHVSQSKSESTLPDCICSKEQHEGALDCQPEAGQDVVSLDDDNADGAHIPSSASRLQRVPFVAEEHSAMFEHDHEDLFRCAEYATDIIAVCFRDEGMHMPDADYMDHQPEINPRMRGILIDWLLEVHMKYKMQTETLFLTVNIVDRYMSLRQVKRRQMQLLGVVALFIASKYEELDPPKAAALAYLTDNAYTREEIIDFEFEVLNALDCEVVVVTPASFLDRLTRANGCGPLQRALVSYLVELSLTEMHMVRHTPSQLVAASVLLSNDLLDVRQRWSAAMAHHSRHPEAALQPIAEELRELLDRVPASPLQAAHTKFQRMEYHHVADLHCCRPRD